MNLKVEEISLLEKHSRPAVRGAIVSLRKAALTSGNATVVDTVDATLDAWAEDRAAEKKITKALAYAEILDEPQGREMYADRCAAMNDPQVIAKRRTSSLERPTDVRKVSSAVAKAENAIAQVAESIRRTGETEAAAWARALEQRPELYSKYLQAQFATAAE